MMLPWKHYHQCHTVSQQTGCYRAPPTECNLDYYLAISTVYSKWATTKEMDNTQVRRSYLPLWRWVYDILSLDECFIHQRQCGQWLARSLIPCPSSVLCRPLHHTCIKSKHRPSVLALPLVLRSHCMLSSESDDDSSSPFKRG